ncbi:unnamed protein product [Bursaphelenchus xylophilus]|uniref:(pine wood nematode) hypothetical protein n=1 Tax=Bursaphelenchus xylophilus TaxID=6326 RepID=A0A1I7S4G6_BURXY|nr:unnamed protein product [Bursaphelenchus xylophilus]CAG9117067.1 unnamed protein product [Bursaphelenchus xylophilus]
MDPDVCYESYLTETTVLIRVVYFTMILVSIWCLFTVVKAIATRKDRRMPVHPNFKIMVANGCAVIIIHSAAIGVSNAVILFNSLRATPTNCATIIDRLSCLGLRSLLMLSIPMFTCVHFMIFVERFVACMTKRNYETTGTTLGTSLAVTGWILSALTELYAIGRTDLSATYIHCSITTDENQHRMLIIFQVLLWFDVLTTCGDGLLRILTVKNSRVSLALRPKAQLSFSTFSGYTLSQAYQRDENLRIMKMMFPIAGAFSAGHLMHSLTSYYVRTHFVVKTNGGETPEIIADGKTRLMAALEAIQMLFMMTGVAVVHLYTRLGKKLKDEKDYEFGKKNSQRHGDVYFSLFEKQIGGKQARNITG